MKDQWDYLIEIDDESYKCLLPSSLQDEWSENFDNINLLFDDNSIIPRNNALLFPQTKLSYFLIKCHKNRSEICSTNESLKISIGDYVIIAATKGIDIGIVISYIENPTNKDLKTAKKIKRKAWQCEIDQVELKTEHEEKAVEICQIKVREMNLPMKITGAEYQFDGRKLTFYYTAARYVDFRELVRVLFQVFNTRIWMVWHDGKAPVKDVFTRNIESNDF